MYLLTTGGQRQLSLIEPLIRRNGNRRAISLHVNSDRRVARRFIPRAAHLVYSKPVLKKVLDAMRCDELMFHLSFKTSALKLDVLPTAVSQLIDPDVAVIVSTPRPCFLTG